MTLLITTLAAVLVTAAWYVKLPDVSLGLGLLCWLYWGAAIMWLVDAVFEYAKLHAAYFTPTPEAMGNDAFLGLAVVVLGLVIWIVSLLLRDPKGTLHAALRKKK
jgi:hypothetical protein